MKLIFAFILFLLFFGGCQSQFETIEIGQKVENSHIVDTHTLLPNNSLMPSVDTIIEKITYTIAWDKTNTIRFISTQDKNFHISNKVTLSSKFSDLGIDEKEIQKTPGWGYYVQLNEQWYAGYSHEQSPKPNSKIGWFFQYSF